MRALHLPIVSLFLTLAATPAFAGGKIVVDHDEWTLSANGYAQAPNADVFARNVASWFTGGQPGHFLMRSGNFGLGNANLAQSMTSAGHTWTVNASAPDTLASLQQYDAVFLCENPINLANLTAYVQGGGCVYLAAGTSSADPTTWNPFLQSFGLQLGALNGLFGVEPIVSSHPLFNGVTGLFQNNGNSITDLTPSDPASQILISHGGLGEYAIYDGGGAPNSYCTAKVNSLGCTPTIGWSGSPSVTSAAPFQISASNVLNNKQGLFFYGYSQQISPFQGGLKCMSSPTRRTPVQNSAGAPAPDNNCSGVYALDFNAWIQGGADALLVAGQEVDGQFWSRDPQSASTTGLTDALHFVVGG